MTRSSATALPALDRAPEAALDLTRLTDALQIDARGFVAFAVFDTAAGRDELMREVEKRLGGEIQIRRVQLTAAHPCLPELLGENPKSRIPNPKRVAYFAYGFEAITEARAKRQMYGALQIKREALGRLGVSIVLWLKPKALNELAVRAADFFAHRGGLYDFRLPDRASHPAVQLKRRPSPSKRATHAHRLRSAIRGG